MRRDFLLIYRSLSCEICKCVREFSGVILVYGCGNVPCKKCSKNVRNILDLITMLQQHVYEKDTLVFPLYYFVICKKC